jgi:hypothetical protein
MLTGEPDLPPVFRTIHNWRMAPGVDGFRYC